MEPRTRKARAIWDHLDQHPDASLTDIERACDVTRTTASTHRTKWKQARDQSNVDQETSPEQTSPSGPEEGIQDAFPPTKRPPRPARVKEDAEATSEQRVVLDLNPFRRRRA